MKIRPLAVALGIVTGAGSTLAGVVLLVGFPVALIVGGVALTAACLVVDF